MTLAELKHAIGGLQVAAADLCERAKMATRHRKSLAGSNFYGDTFHERALALSRLEAGLSPALAQDATAEGWAAAKAALSVLRSAEASPQARATAFRDLKAACETVLLPAIESQAADPIPKSEHVLPMSVVRGTRGYIERTVQQANGCYEHQWYEACSVMIRRLVEMLIIGLYESKNRAQDIKDPRSGEFLMLSGLVDVLLKDPAFNLGRETKRGLPLVKSLGDRSAHARYFMARKDDVDKVLHDLRVIVDELLIQSGLRT